MNKHVFAASASVLALAAGAASAQTAAPSSAKTAGASSDELEAVIVTGTRTTGLKAVDSAAPIQVLDATSLQRVGQPDLIQALSQNVPSLQAQGFATDAAQLSPSFKLRGLSPNNTLVLINGKRRHGTANLAVIAGPFQGGAAPDINFIPTGEIDHVEVLTDGAAAQYGTDAIAGVINIITKKANHGGQITLNSGQYYEGDGQTADLMANIGLAPLGDRSYLNLTYESRYKGSSVRSAPDARTYNHAITTAATSSDCPAAYRYANGTQTFCNNVGAGGLYAASLNNPDYPITNKVHGDALMHLNVGTYDAGYDFGGIEAYSFGSYGHKNAQANENYRTPTIAPAVYPTGFTPKLEIQEDDYQGTVGAKTTWRGWSLDLSTTYGRDDETLYVENTINATALANLGLRQNYFYAGKLIADQWTSNFDITHDFNVGMASPLTFAAGVEYRDESYDIHPGEFYSYSLGGSQSYSGFSTIVAGKHTRDNVGVYADFALSPVAKLKLDGAVRYENYSDFGDTTVGKITGRYDFTDTFALRGTVSTGFRAPTLAEAFYSGVNVSPSAASGQFPPNSAGVATLGFSPLKPETSVNLSFGVVAHPLPRLTATFDAYDIKIDDRILGSGSIYGIQNGVVRSIAVNNALAASGYSFPPGVTSTSISLFTNGIDTDTTGAEAVITYVTPLADLGRIEWTASGNYSNTAVTHIAPSPAQIAPQTLFDRTAISFIQDAPPKYKLIFGALWTMGPLSVNLREEIYGRSHVVLQGADGLYYPTKVSATPITDLEASLRLPHNLKLTVGGNNILDKYPNKLDANYYNTYIAYNRSGSAVQYPTYSPFGFQGGYYYAKLSYTF